VEYKFKKLQVKALHDLLYNYDMQENDLDTFWEGLGEKLEDIGEIALLKKLLEQAFDKKFIEKSRL
jgi:hypothetical protein